MATEHSAILNRLAAGEITADEAAELLRQPNRSTTGTPAPPAADAQYAGRRLRVRVTNLETGRARADINVPLSWVELGMKIGSHYDPRIAGLDFGEIVEQIRSGADCQIVDVEDSEEGERVEVFIE